VIEIRYPVVKLLKWRERNEELAARTNPFAVAIRAHLAAQGATEARGRAKIGIIRGLFGQGYERGQVMDLLRLIDWFVVLPPEQERLVEQELERIEEEQRMAYVTSWERMGLQEGELRGQRAMLRRVVQTRFGVLPEVLDARIANADQDTLAALADRASVASSLDDLVDASAP